MLTINEETREVTFVAKQPFNQRFVEGSVLFNVPLSNHEVVLLERLGWSTSQTRVGWDNIDYITVSLIDSDEVYLDLVVDNQDLPIRIKAEEFKALNRLDFEADFCVKMTDSEMGPSYSTTRVGIRKYVTKVR